MDRLLTSNFDELNFHGPCHELYLAGQLFTHLYAAHLHDGASTPTLSPEQKLKALLFVLQLGYEKSEPAIVD